MDVRDLYHKYGQSVWLDYIRRNLLQSGEFARLVQNDGIRGVTSNPSIFEKAIAGSTDYDVAIERFQRTKDATASAIYEQLAVEDIQQAADVLLAVYKESDRRDGYVSLEVSPYLAHDTRATIDEATRLWHKVRRDTSTQDPQVGRCLVRRARDQLRRIVEEAQGIVSKALAVGSQQETSPAMKGAAQ